MRIENGELWDKRLPLAAFDEGVGGGVACLKLCPRVEKVSRKPENSFQKEFSGFRDVILEGEIEFLAVDVIKLGASKLRTPVLITQIKSLNAKKRNPAKAGVSTKILHSQLSILHCQNFSINKKPGFYQKLSTINYQLSAINCPLSTAFYFCKQKNKKQRAPIPIALYIN